MFTGIIEEVGEVTQVQRLDDAARITVRGPIAAGDAKHGDSIAVNGVCLTAVGLDGDEFTADVMRETLAMSTLEDAAVGMPVNLERAAQLGDRLGGHIVQGHVDGTAEVLAITDGSAWRVVRFTLAPELAPLVARKGSIAIDGTSLTVSAVGRAASGGSAAEESTVGRAASGGSAADKNSAAGEAGAGGHWFEVSLIPETLTATTLGQRKVGDLVNVETDIVARHVERMLEFRPLTAAAKWAVDAEETPAAQGATGTGKPEEAAAAEEQETRA